MKRGFWGSVLAISITLAGSMAFAADNLAHSGQVTSQIDYRFVGHLGQFDDQGRQLVWVGAIKGGLTGEMKWWFVMPPPVSGSQFSFYSARWEIRDGEVLLLAGDSAGKTVFPSGADGIWDGHGVVTEAGEGLKPLKGHKVYETGPVVLGENPPVTYHGTGMFLVY